MTFALKSAAAIAAAAAALLSAGPALGAPVVLTSTMTGAAGPDGSATIRVEIEPALGDFCYVLAFKGLGAVTDAVVLPADAAPDAKPLLSLELTGVETDACVAAEPDLLKPIAADPGKYQVVVRSKALPQGAVKGVLARQ